LEENDAWVQCAMGMAEFVSGEQDQAMGFYQRAIELNPNFALAHGYFALVLAHAGKPARAIEEAERALRLSPRDPERVHFLIAIATAHFVAGDYGEAIRWAERTLQVRPSAPAGHRLLAASLAHRDRLDEAHAAVERLLRLRPGTTTAGVRATIHFKHQPDQERLIEGLLRAGLPAA
jgi:tetratricopeptide (TPR) repeat protein